MRQILSFGLYGLAAALALACSSSTNNDDGASSSSSSSSSGAGGTAAGTGGGGGVGQGGNGQGGNGQGGNGQGGVGQGGVGQGGTAQGGSGQGGQGTAGAGGSPATTCTWAAVNPCPSGQYCNAPGCGAGQCEPVGTTDNPTKMVVCGCDNVNYWNADTAAVHGMAMKGAGSCTQAAFCGGIANLQCPQPAHYCNGQVPSSGDCNISDPGGYCWGMPLTCSQIGFGGTQRQCNNPNGACLYECDAIKSEQIHYLDSTCPM